ncbi:PXA domain-containing protein [Polychytrium aggregatum]|uniref:PXA domain-containing protein n=1 Tax=Polychytrium aggregatum TaxID=110093 RepID=UPI0022FDC579|nr:PXA domain-containing protein [Polychytrium aggregatum]KAI9202684.1 PXA domain-containing protein [Polychytrium aggregatum]
MLKPLRLIPAYFARMRASQAMHIALSVLTVGGAYVLRSLLFQLLFVGSLMLLAWYGAPFLNLAMQAYRSGSRSHPFYNSSVFASNPSMQKAAASAIRPLPLVLSKNWETHRLARRQESAGLARRILFSKDKRIQEKLDKLVELVVRDFVRSWYTGYISPDVSFVATTEKALSTTLHQLILRIEKVDSVSFILTKILPLVTAHLASYPPASADQRDSTSDYEREIVRVYLRNRESKAPLRGTLARDLAKGAELAHLRKLVGQTILPAICPENELKSSTMSLLIREILTCRVLHPIIELLADPLFWGQSIDALADRMTQQKQDIEFNIREVVGDNQDPEGEMPEQQLRKPADESRTSRQKDADAATRSSRLKDGAAAQSEPHRKDLLLEEDEVGPDLRPSEPKSKPRLPSLGQWKIEISTHPNSKSHHKTRDSVSSVVPTFRTCLAEPRLLKQFNEYLAQERRLDYLNFFLDVEALRNHRAALSPIESNARSPDRAFGFDQIGTPGPAECSMDRSDTEQSSRDPQLDHEELQRLYQRYFSSLADGALIQLSEPQQSARSDIEELLAKKGTITEEDEQVLSVHIMRLLRRAQDDVWKTMETDDFPKFLKSTFFSPTANNGASNSRRQNFRGTGSAQNGAESDRSNHSGAEDEENDKSIRKRASIITGMWKIAKKKPVTTEASSASLLTNGSTSSGVSTTDKGQHGNGIASISGSIRRRAAQPELSRPDGGDDSDTEPQQRRSIDGDDARGNDEAQQSVTKKRSKKRIVEPWFIRRADSGSSKSGRFSSKDEKRYFSSNQSISEQEENPAAGRGESFVVTRNSCPGPPSAHSDNEPLDDEPGTSASARKFRPSMTVKYTKTSRAVAKGDFLESMSQPVALNTITDAGSNGSGEDSGSDNDPDTGLERACPKPARGYESDMSAAHLFDLPDDHTKAPFEAVEPDAEATPAIDNLPTAATALAPGLSTAVTTEAPESAATLASTAVAPAPVAPPLIPSASTAVVSTQAAPQTIAATSAISAATASTTGAMGLVPVASSTTTVPAALAAPLMVPTTSTGASAAAPLPDLGSKAITIDTTTQRSVNPSTIPAEQLLEQINTRSESLAQLKIEIGEYQNQIKAAQAEHCPIEELRKLRLILIGLEVEYKRMEQEKNQLLKAELEQFMCPGTIAVQSVVERAQGEDAERRENITYDVEVRRLAQHAVTFTSSAAWILRKRYSDFNKLHNYMRIKFPHVVSGLEFPSKLAITKTQRGENRRIGLEKYIQGLLRNSEVCKDVEIWKFFGNQEIAKVFSEAYENGVLTADQPPSPTKRMMNRFLNTDQIDKLLKFRPFGSEGGPLPFPMADLFKGDGAASAPSAAMTLAGIGSDLSNGSAAPAGASSVAVSDSILQIFMELFELNKHSWLRKTALNTVMQPLFGGALERRAVDGLRYLLNDDSIAYYLDYILSSLWPELGPKPSATGQPGATATTMGTASLPSAEAANSHLTSVPQGSTAKEFFKPPAFTNPGAEAAGGPFAWEALSPSTSGQGNSDLSDSGLERLPRLPLPQSPTDIVSPGQHWGEFSDLAAGELSPCPITSSSEAGQPQSLAIPQQPQQPQLVVPMLVSPSMQRSQQGSGSSPQSAPPPTQRATTRAGSPTPAISPTSPSPRSNLPDTFPLEQTGPAHDRTPAAEQDSQTRVFADARVKLETVLPDLFTIIVGRQNAKRGASRVCHIFHNRRLNLILCMEILEAIVVELFQSNDEKTSPTK